jgi:hypothetical protein
MLLELLQHHHGLFHAVIEALISARNAADLVRLATCCQQLRLFIVELSFYKHYGLFRCSLKNIKNMNTLSNEYCSIKEYNNDLHVFRYDPAFIWDRRMYMLEDNYYIRTIKARIFYRIRCNNRVDIIKNNNIVNNIIIYINGPIPSWMIKYSIYMSDKALQCYTFTT